MLEVHLGGAKDARAALSALIGVADDLDIQNMWPGLVNDVIHPWFLENAAALIKSGGRLVGESWDYSGEPKYAASKKAQVGHLEMFRWDKAGGKEVLYPSLTDAKDPLHYFKMTGNRVSIGTSVPYAKRLTVGGVGPAGESYPGRSLMPNSPQMNKRLLTYMQRYIGRELASSGKRIGDVRQNL